MDVRGKKVLILGDSLAHRGPACDPDVVEVIEASTTRDSSPGDLFASHLLAHGAASARLNARMGRTAALLLAEPGTLAQEAARHPEVVLVVLGQDGLDGNFAGEAERLEEIRTAFAGLEIWGLGPPSYAPWVRLASGQRARHRAMFPVAAMREVFGERFIDLRRLTWDMVEVYEGRTDTGLGFTREGAVKLAARLAEQFLKGRSLGERLRSMLDG